MSVVGHCSTKGCKDPATHRYIDPNGTEFPSCFKDLQRHIRDETLAELRKQRGRKQ